MGLFLIFSLLIILSSDSNPVMATSAALLVPSIILTANADFFSGIIATKTPSAPFFINAFLLRAWLK